MVRTSNMCYLRSILGPRARFVRLNTGHGINTERPDQVNPILERHFDDGFDKASSNINENENENENGHEHGKDYDHIDDATMKNEQMRPTSSSSSSFDEQCMHTLLQGCNHNGSCFINISRGMVRGWISIGQVYLLIFLAYHLYSYLYNDYYTNRFYSTRNTGLDSDNRSVDDASYFLHERLDQWKRSFRAEGILLFTLVGLAVGIGRGLFRSILCVYRRVRMVKQWRKQHPIGCRCEHIHNHRSAHENIDTRRRLSPQRLYRALPSPRETVESCTARYTLHYPQVASFFAVCNLCMFYMLLRYLFL